MNLNTRVQRERKRKFSKQSKQNSKVNPRKTGVRQQANHLVRTLLSKESNRSKGRSELHQVKLSPRKKGLLMERRSMKRGLQRHVLQRERKKVLQSRKRKKEEATEHSLTDNERILSNALQRLELEQLKQAVSATMQDVVSLPVTLSERRSARHQQEAHLAFRLYAMKRTGVALNQVTIARAYEAICEKQGMPGGDSHKNWFS